VKLHHFAPVLEDLRLAGRRVLLPGGNGSGRVIGFRKVAEAAWLVVGGHRCMMAGAGWGLSWG